MPYNMDWTNLFFSFHFFELSREGPYSGDYFTEIKKGKRKESKTYFGVNKYSKELC